MLIDDKIFHDGVDITPADVFRSVEAEGKTCKTAAINAFDYERFFADFSPKYEAVIHICLGSGFSSCYQNAILAAECFKNVYVIDSQNLSSGSGGKMTVGKKYRGSFERCLEHYIRDKLYAKKDIDYSRVFITHPMCSVQIVEKVKEIIHQYAHFEEIIETPAGCTVSSHCGPVTLGILFKRKTGKDSIR